MDSAWLSSSTKTPDHDPYDDWANALADTSAPRESATQPDAKDSLAPSSPPHNLSRDSASEPPNFVAADMSASSNLSHVFGHIPHAQQQSTISSDPMQTLPLPDEEQIGPVLVDTLDEDATATSYLAQSQEDTPVPRAFNSGNEAAGQILNNEHAQDAVVEDSTPSLTQEDHKIQLDTSSTAPISSFEDVQSTSAIAEQEIDAADVQVEPARQAEHTEHTDRYTQQEGVQEAAQENELDWMAADDDHLSTSHLPSQAQTAHSTHDNYTAPYNSEDAMPAGESYLASDARSGDAYNPNDGREEDTDAAERHDTEDVYGAEDAQSLPRGIESAFETSEDDWAKQLASTNEMTNGDDMVDTNQASIQESSPATFEQTADEPADLDWMQSAITDGQPPPASQHDAEPDMGWLTSDAPVANTTSVTAGSATAQPSTLTSEEGSNLLDAAKPAVEDSWAQAFGDPAALDDTWGAAFADDDEGFLEDEPIPAAVAVPEAAPKPSRPTSLYAPAGASTTTPSVPAPSSFTPVPAPFANAYGVPAAVQPQSVTQRSTSTPMQFFEDLPTNRPLPTRRPKQQVLSPSPPVIPPPPSGSAASSVPGRPIAPPRTSSAAYSQYTQLRSPEKLDPFPPQASLDTPQVAIVPPPAAPAASNRYSPALSQPNTAVTADQQSIPGAPRNTGSQLAQPPQPFPQRIHSPYAPNSGTTVNQTQQIPQQPPKSKTPVMFEELPITRSPQRSHGASSRYAQPSTTSAPPSASLGQPVPNLRPAPPPAATRFVPRTSSPLAYAGMPTRNGDQSGQTAAQQGAMPPPPLPNQRYGTVPSSRPGGAPKMVERSVSYAPQQITQSTLQESFIPTPPVRPRTSSPVHMRAQPQSRIPPVDQSVTTQVTPSQAFTAPSTVEHDIQDFVFPQDETAADQLQRWRGAPIFRWGAGGLLVTSIPKHIPRYGGGQSAPKLKPTSGEVKLQRSRDIIGDDNGLGTFPGPLKSKGKKKDVMSWLSTRITALEQMTASNAGGIRQAEEKVLLWKVLRLFVEHDGALTGNPNVITAVKELLAMDLSSTEPATASSANETPQVPQPGIINDIRTHLIQGDREKAVWHAVDNQLWGHALVLASTAENNLWKQVVQEFVKKQVRSASQDSRSLAALYEVFAGNWEESIDQLVPLAARQGFQMVNTADQNGQARDSTEGLEKWRETLTLIVNNRSNGDENALVALGKLLMSYGRVEAAHICYLFARNVAVFGGADDPQTHFALLGTDLTSESSPKIVDSDAILLTEVYEFALSLAPSAPTFFPPHLQSYKLQHAYQLAEIGLRSEGQQYCEAITSALKSSTRGSSYYHPLLVAAVDDLSKRLSQSPQTSSSGWISKLSTDKVTGSVWSKFNKFVVGDEGDIAQAAAAAQAEEAGPFGRVGTGTPTISRSPSVADFHPNDMVRVPSNIGAGGGRYAPSSYSSSPEQSRPIQNPYATSYGLSADMIQKPFDRRLSQDAMPSFGSPPRHPPFQRQSSALSRYATNESASANPEPLGMQPTTPHESYVPLIAESVPEGSAVDHASYPESRRTSMQPANAYTPSGPVTPSMEYGAVPRPANNRYSTSSAVSISRPPSVARYAPSVVESETTSSYAPPAPLESSFGDDAATSYRPSNPPDGTADDEVAAEHDEADEVSKLPATNIDAAPSYGYQPYEPLASSGGAAASSTDIEEETGLTFDTGMKNQNGNVSNVYDPMAGYQPSNSYEPSASSYDPNAGGGYMPYQPDMPTTDPAEQAEEEDAEDAPKPKRKGIMDLDDDDDTFLQKQAEDLKRQQKAQRDREADELVRKAAEADAARDALSPTTKKGWLGGWFGGGGNKKDASASAPVVHKGKLGEKLSLYYDPETKKWVNPNATPEEKAASAAKAKPPPPRAAPPPSATGLGTPPLGGMPPSPVVGAGSGNVTPLGGPPGGAAKPPTPAGVPLPPSAPGSVPSSAPPSRPPTGLGGANDLDDLLGGPGPRKGGAAGARGKKGKGGSRYVDVMAK